MRLPTMAMVYLQLCLGLLIIISTSDGFFLSWPTSVPSPPVSCYAGDFLKVDGLNIQNYGNVRRMNQSLTRFCAFEEDRGVFNASNYIHRTYTAMPITNTLRQMSRTRCQGFTNTSDVGYGACTPRPYEQYTSIVLCICATDFCNRNLSTCLASIASGPLPPINGPQVIPTLTTPIRCYDNSYLKDIAYNAPSRNSSYMCALPIRYLNSGSRQVPTKLIDQTACDDYVRANTVLCGVDASSDSPFYFSSYELGNQAWTNPHLIRYTAEDYSDILTTQFVSPPYVDSYYARYGYNFMTSSSASFEGSTNVVVRRHTYDTVGNLLDASALSCFCSTDYCNSDFATCAAGINYNITDSMDATSTTTSSPSSSKPSTVTMTPLTSTTTVNPTTTTLPPLVFYRFDGDGLDFSANYNSSLIGGANFTAGGYINSALLLTQLTQYLQTSFINLAYQSFTISGWISTSTTMNATIFSQCSAQVARKCMSLGIVNQYLSMDFFGGFNTTGTTLVSTSRWIYVAFVYDQVTQQQTIYLNGIQDGRSAPGSTPPYLGTCQSVRIGGGFLGMIDHLSISNRVKTPAEILAEATLVASYSFDNTLTDSGPNGIIGSGTNTFDGNGRLGQAFAFNDDTARFQANGLTVFSVPNQSFSLSFWIKPRANISQTTLVMLSSANWCMQLLEISSARNVTFRMNGLFTVAANVSTMDWTHLALTYSPANNARFFINGIQKQNLVVAFPNSPTAATLTIGGQTAAPVSCTNGTGLYKGLFDELKIYSRELSFANVIDLANS